MGKTIYLITEEVLKGVVFGILPFLVFILITSKTDLLGGIRSFVVLTGSMEPTIPVSTIVFTHPLDVYKLNDVIAFKKEDRTVTHRIIDVEDKGSLLYYKTMGDANNISDSDLVPQSNVLGNVFFAIPYAGRIVFFINTVPGYLALIVFPAGIFIIFELISINNEMKKETEKKLLQQMQMI